jgi:hypothetical protein
MAAANDLLASNGLIVDSNSIRTQAVALKNALDRANNNRNFLVRCGDDSARDADPVIAEELVSSDVSVTVSAYPNPFVDKVNIEFSAMEKTQVQIQMFSVSGQNLQTLFDGTCEKDQRYKVEFIPPLPGVYIYRMVTAEGTKTGKVVQLK